MFQSQSMEFFAAILSGSPKAYAVIKGSEKYPGIQGRVLFYQAGNGCLVFADIDGLPASGPICEAHIFGFHIHEGGKCSGNKTDPFADSGLHYNPNNCEHPAHAGDLPPLFGNEGYAWMIVYTDRFQPEEVIGKTAILHDMPDDFKTQPSGGAGEKIACGEIEGN